MANHLFRLAVLTAACLGVVRAGSPQFRAGVDMVPVYATVRSGNGEFLRNLTKDDFELLDNGQRREITVFSADLQPSTIALVLDRSWSVAHRSKQIAAAAATFLDKLVPDDRASLASLSWECHPLTTDKKALAAIARDDMPEDPGSPVWGGTNRAISTVTQEGGRRAVLLFSDGDDRRQVLFAPATTLPDGRTTPCVYKPDTSMATIEDIISRAERESVMLYTVSVDGSDRADRDGDLRRVARESGGERYRLRDFNELAGAFARIADELHHQYLLGFVPAAFDNKRHDIEVRVRARGATVRARKSYIAARALPRPMDGAAPATEPSPGEIEKAIAEGREGNVLHASCRATGKIPNPEDDRRYAEVTAEGPIGRIMRSARDAKARGVTFTADQVTAELRAPVVEVSAELRLVSSTQSFRRVAGAGSLVTMRVRSRDLIGIALEPVNPAVRSLPFKPVARLVQRFDLAGFRALPGADVEIVVHSTTGIRRCTIPGKDRARVR